MSNNQKNGKPRHPLSILRQKKNLTQAEMGVLLGLNGAVIAQVEAGNTTLSNKAFYAVSEVFKIDPDKLYGDIKDYQVEYRNYLIDRL